MISIDAESGRISWGEYHLDIRLTHSQFKARYPSLKPYQVGHTEGGHDWYEYKLPVQEIGSFPSLATTSFTDDLLNGITIKPEPPLLISDDDWHIQLQWIQTARDFLRRHFGTPNHTQKAHLLAELDYLPTDLTDEIIEWRYKFSWGSASLTHDIYDWDEIMGIGYNRLQQIRDWNEFIQHLRRRIQIAERANRVEGDCPAGIRKMLDVILQIRSALEYRIHKPSVGCYTLGLKIPGSRALVWVHAIENDPDKYKIQRTDVGKVYIVEFPDITSKVLELL